MQKEEKTLDAIKFVGIKTRTNNATEMTAETGKIWPVVQKYFHGQLAEQISCRIAPGEAACYNLKLS